MSRSTNSPPRLLFAGPVPGTPGWEIIAIVVAITLPSGATAVSAAVIASRVNEDGIALSVDSRIYVLPPGLLELSGLALRLEAPTGRIPMPNGRSAATTVTLLVLARPGYGTARPLGPGDVLVTTDIPLEEGLAIVTYPEPTVQLALEGPNAGSTTVSVGEGDRTSRYADDGPGYND